MVAALAVSKSCNHTSEKWTFHPNFALYFTYDFYINYIFKTSINQNVLTLNVKFKQLLKIMENYSYAFILGEQKHKNQTQ